MRLSKWDAYSLSLLALFSCLIIINHFEFPLSLDIYYHLGVAQEFNRGGGFTLINFSEFAPMGRAQLYPPLLQILSAIILKTGISPMLLAKLLNILIFPAFLFVFWRILKSLLADKESFFAILLLSTPYSLFVSCVDNIPATICIMLILGTLYMLEKGKIISASILLGLAFYSHLAFAIMGCVTFLIYGIVKKEDLKKVILTASGAILISSVFLTHIILNLGLLRKGGQNDPLEISWLIYILAAFAIFHLIKTKQIKKYLFWVIFALVSLAILATYPFRFFSGQGMLPLIILSAIALAQFFDLFEKNTHNLFAHLPFKIFAFFIILNFVWPLFVLNTYPPPKTINVLGDTTFRELSHTIEPQSFRLHDVSIYSRFANEISEIIKENVGEDEIIFSNMGIFGQLLSVISERPNASGMLSEVKPRLNIDPFAVSKLFVAIKTEDAEKDLTAEHFAKRYGFEEIEETEIAVIYKKNEAEVTRPKNFAIITFPYIYVFLIILIALIIFDLKYLKPKNSSP